MKIVVIGASKGIGRETVTAALEKGHQVTAFSRHPENIGFQHPNLHLQAGNVLNVSSVNNAIKGQDAVICTLGMPTLRAVGPPFSKRSYVLSTGTSNILKAMESHGVKRLICITASGSGGSQDQCTPLARLTLRYGLRWLFKEKDRQEELIKSSNTQWTIIRPTALTKGRKKGGVISKNVRSGILTHISRADVAAFIINILDRQTTHQKALAISYPPQVGDSIRWIAGYFGIG